jgi:RHS repeat-associated protein
MEITDPTLPAQSWKSYYFAGTARIAVRTNGALAYLLSDHLGSTSLTVSPTGVKVADMQYKAWGETRTSTGTTPTDYQYTGQRNENSIGLYYYNARWYDASLGRFAQADTIIPAGVQGLDRYAYVSNSPLMATDPSGNTETCDADGYCGDQNNLPVSEQDMIRTIETEFSNVDILSGEWTLKELSFLYDNLKALLSSFGTVENLTEGVGNLVFSVVDEIKTGGDCDGAKACASVGENTTNITLTHRALNPENDKNIKNKGHDIPGFAIVHEIGHAFDYHGHRIPQSWRFIQDVCTTPNHDCDGKNYMDQDFDQGGNYADEVYASAFAAYILGDMEQFSAQKNDIIAADIAGHTKH